MALSGGVDSSTVAALARTALGEQLVALTVTGSAVSGDEREVAARVAANLGLRHRFVEAEPLADAAYRANGADRCYRCRTVEGRAIRAVGEREGAVQFLDGLHLDDLGDDRPGIRAMDEAGFAHPLLWAGWRKHDVRSYARAVGLPNWERPSNACLASRVARGEPISGDLLERIDRAEGLLRERGFRRIRVRVQGGSARIEVGAAETGRLQERRLQEELTGLLLGLGFRSVSFDPIGARPRGELPVLP